MDRWRPVGQRRAALGNSDGVARGLADFAYVTLTSQGSSGAADTHTAATRGGGHC